MKRLIVNADDFGLTPGVNTAVVELNKAGVLSSSTLMAAGPSFADAVHLAFVQPTLGVGCHVVLTDGSPVLHPSDIPSLIDPADPDSGQFRPALTSFVRDALRGRIRGEEIEAEAVAQISRIRSSGLNVTHLDTHKHTHVLRSVLRPLLRAAQRSGVRAIRNPFESLWSLRATPSAGALRGLLVHALLTRRAPFARLAAQTGIATPDGSFGVLATGTLDRAALRAMLSQMPDGVWELVCHPGYHDTALDHTRTRLRGEREIERQTLLEVIPQALEEDHELEMIGFGQLVNNGS